MASQARPDASYVHTPPDTGAVIHAGVGDQSPELPETPEFFVQYLLLALGGVGTWSGQKIISRMVDASCPGDVSLAVPVIIGSESMGLPRDGSSGGRTVRDVGGVVSQTKVLVAQPVS